MDLLPVEALTRPTDAFRCEPYRASITAKTCLARRAETFEGGRNQGHAPATHSAFPACAKCPIGAQVAARVTLPADPKTTCSCGATVKGQKKRKPVCTACRKATAVIASKGTP